MTTVSRAGRAENVSQSVGGNQDSLFLHLAGQFCCQKLTCVWIKTSGVILTNDTGDVSGLRRYFQSLLVTSVESARSISQTGRRDNQIAPAFGLFNLPLMGSVGRVGDLSKTLNLDQPLDDLAVCLASNFSPERNTNWRFMAS